MSKRNACLVINPRSGQNVEKLTDILSILNAAGYQTHVVLKEYPGHTQELARNAAKENYNLVISYGGDGTLNRVVNGVMSVKSKSKIGVIPGGTANLWATEVGIPTDSPVKATLALLESEVRCVDTGYVSIDDFWPTDGVAVPGKRSNTIKQAERAHFLLMAGLGLDAVVMQGVSKPLKHKIKQLAVGLSAARELPAYRPFPIEVRDADKNLLWQGEALQVIIGNTRLYADIFHMTPDAHIDDGQLDVCVITTGTPLATLQQIFSLLLRRQPDELTAEYFRGPRLYMRVPPSVGLQLDGSAVKQKKYLNKAQKKALKSVEKTEEVLLEYCFEALPKTLRIAIPHTYDNTLFSANEDAPVQPAENPSVPALPMAEQSEPVDSELLASVRQKSRRVGIVGMAYEQQHGAAIVAGRLLQQGTIIDKPVAVRVDASTTILTNAGIRSGSTSLRQLNEGSEILVAGKKQKHNVIEAEYIILPG